MGTLGVPRNLRANRGDLSQRGGLSERYWTEAMGVKRLFFHTDLPAAASPHAGRLHVLWSANTPKRPGGLPESRSCEVVPLLRVICQTMLSYGWRCLVLWKSLKPITNIRSERYDPSSAQRSQHYECTYRSG